MRIVSVVSFQRRLFLRWAHQWFYYSTSGHKRFETRRLLCRSMNGEKPDLGDIPLREAYHVNV